MPHLDSDIGFTTRILRPRRGHAGLPALIAIMCLLVSDASAEPWKKGDQVVVANGASLRVQSETVGRIPPGTVVEVRVVNGQWIWVEHDVKGWIRADTVVSLTSHVDQLLAQGFQAFNDRNYEGAAQQLERVIEIDPEPGYPMYLLGVIASQHRKQFEQGIAWFNRAEPHLADQPKSKSLLHANRAQAYLHLGRHDEAIRDCNAAIELMPNDYQPWLLRADIRRKLGNLTQAISDYTVAIHLQSRLLKSQSESAASVAETHMKRGQAFSKDEDYVAAAADFAMAADLDPTGYRHGWMAAARALCRIDKISKDVARKAVRYARQACEGEKVPRPDWLATLAEAHHRAGEPGFAAQVMEKALARFDAPDATAFTKENRAALQPAYRDLLSSYRSEYERQAASE